MNPSRNPVARLRHIRDEIDGVAEAIESVSFGRYRSSYVLRRAVERALQIISEAAKALPADRRTHHPDAPWSDIIGIGNVLRHEYQHVDDRRLWDVATVHLPKLRDVVSRMLNEPGER